MEIYVPKIQCDRIEEYSENGQKFLRYWGNFHSNNNVYKIFILKLSLDFQSLELQISTRNEKHPVLSILSLERKCFAIPFEQNEDGIFFTIEEGEKKNGSSEN